MKRLLALLIALVFVLSMSACNDKKNESAETNLNSDEKIETASSDTEKATKSETKKNDKATTEVKTENKSEKEKSVKEEAATTESVPATSSAPAPDVKMEDNKIVNTTKDDAGNTTVQEFIYENDELTGINVTMKFDSEKEAKEYYENMVNGDSKEENADKYENVELNGDCVQAEYKDEQVEPMKALAQDEMYLILNSAITTYEVTE